MAQNKADHDKFGIVRLPVTWRALQGDNRGAGRDRRRRRRARPRAPRTWLKTMRIMTNLVSFGSP